jgi:hypothetical protein
MPELQATCRGTGVYIHVASYSRGTSHVKTCAGHHDLQCIEGIVMSMCGAESANLRWSGSCTGSKRAGSLGTTGTTWRNRKAQ